MALSQVALAEGLPNILSHSNTRIVARQGDKIALEVSSDNDSDKVQWWLKKKKICKGKQCQVDTSTWEPNIYKVFSIVSNDFGSRSIIFYIKVKVPDEELAKKDISPELIKVDANEAGKIQDDRKGNYAYAMKGTGFSWSDDRLLLLKTAPRKLKWNEKIKSAGSSIQFGNYGHDEHFLLPGSMAQLLKIGNRRLVNLKKGTIRSRQLNTKKPSGWTVVVGDWLQLDGENLGDFSVSYSKKKDEAVIHVYSGQVRVLREMVTVPSKSQKKGNKTVGTSVKKSADAKWLIAGTKVKINRKKLNGGIKILSRKKTKAIFIRTTGELLGKEHNTRPRKIVQNLTDLAVNNPFKDAGDAIESRHFSKALWLLYQIPENSKDNPRWNRLMGLALGGLNMAKTSIEYLTKSFEGLKSGQVAYAIGLRYFENGQWAKAEEWFKKAIELEDQSEQQVMYYYLGVIAFKAKNYPLADQYFEKSNWYAEEESIVESIETFRLLIPIYKTWGAIGGLGFILDTNLFQTSHKDNLTFHDEISGLSGFGYQGHAKAWKYFFQTKSFALGLGYDAKRKGWIKKSLHSVDQIDQKFITDMYIGNRNRFYAKSYIQTLIVGGERALDALVLETIFSSKAYKIKPWVGLNMGVYKDPEPGRVDVLDPLSRDLQAAASDRSSRQYEAFLGSRVWWDPRQEVNFTLFGKQRDFTNSFTLAETYTALGSELTHDIRFLGESQLKTTLLFDQTKYLEDPNTRVDSHYEIGFKYLFDFEDGGRFHFGSLYESRSSTEETQVYTKYIFTTGMEIHL